MKRIFFALFSLLISCQLTANTGQSFNPFPVSKADQVEMNELQLNQKLWSEFKQIKKQMFTEKNGQIPVLQAIQLGKEEEGYPVLKSIDEVQQFFERKPLVGFIKDSGMSSRQFAVIERTITYYQVWAKMMRDNMGMTLAPPNGSGEKNMKFVYDHLDQIIVFNNELWTSIGLDPDEDAEEDEPYPEE